MCNNVTLVEPLVFSLTFVCPHQTNMNIVCIGLTLKIILRKFDFFINLSTEDMLINIEISIISVYRWQILFLLKVNFIHKHPTAILFMRRGEVRGLGRKINSLSSCYLVTKKHFMGKQQRRSYEQYFMGIIFIQKIWV